MLSVLLKNPFLLLLIPFVLGIHCYTLFDYTVFGYWIYILFVLSVTLFTWLHFVKNTATFLQTGRMFAAAFSFFILGVISMSLSDIQNNKHWYGHILNNTKAFKVRIDDNPLKKEKSWFLEINMLASIQENNTLPVQGKCYLYLFSKDSSIALHKGDEIIIPNELVRINNADNPYGFDYAAYCRTKGVYHQMFIQPDEIFLWKKSERKQDLISIVKSSVNNSITKNVKDSTTSGLMTAIMLNERALLHDDIWKTYSQTGIVHIIAISGMHVSLLFELLLYALFWIKSKKWQWLKYAMALPIVWFYVILTDNPASAVRAAVMFSIVALSVFVNKDPKPINSWSAAAFFMLFIQPQWLYNVGMQLSFLCILSIMLFYNPIYRLFYSKNKIIDYLWKGIAVSLAVQILVVPIVIYYFHQFPIWSVVANMPAGIYSVVLMYGTIAIAILAPFGVNCVWIGEMLILSTKWFNALIALLASLSPLKLMQLSMDKLDFTLMMLAISFISIFVFFPKAKYLKASLVSMIFMLFSFCVKDFKATKQERLIVYNTNGISSADLILGKKYYPINYANVMIPDKVQLGVLKPARIGYRAAMEGQNMVLGNLVKVNQKSILFLQNDAPINIPVDVLVIAKSVKNIEDIITQTSVKQIVLDGTVNRAMAQKWIQKLQDYDVAVHSVINNGAWIEE